MIIKEIHLTNFRNYEKATAEFAENTNLIYGKNAQGKTNLLEAVNFLATGRSFRVYGDKDIISFDKMSAVVKAIFTSSGRTQTIEVRFLKGKKREILLNEVKLKKSSDLSGKFTSVFFGPDDLNIVKSGAQVRRKLLDNCLSQLRPRYLSTLAEFNRLYEHKAGILRDYRNKPSLLELLDDFNYQLAVKSSILIYYRSAFSYILAQKAAEIHNDFSSQAEKLSVVYKTVGDINHFGRKPEDLMEELLKHQKDKYHAELNSGLVLSGAHKDDLEISIDGHAARKFASQGQTRTAAVAIKLAEREMHYEDRGEYPVLLLDDVLSELDSQRQSFILQRIKSGQVIITCCDDTVRPMVADCKLFNVSNGEISF